MSEERAPLLGSSFGNSSSQVYSTTYSRGNSLGGNQQDIVDFRPRGSFYRNSGHGSMVDTLEKVTLSWENVNVYVNPPSRACCRGPDPSVPTKHVLRDVYGHVTPGTLLAIIGASGSGKTTLLNTLTCRINSQVLNASGFIRVNGTVVGNGIRNISAYVQQDDLFIATMTVREHLRFRALLRMDKEMTKQRRLQRVEDVINELGLSKCANNLIGDPGRLKGISGGEMRRLSFASEILTNPPLLFCDEPTSGLDSFMAENIVNTLKDMAGKGRTVLCTIHQPSSEVFALFDTVLVMAEGRVAFMGSTAEALKFYQSVGYPCPVNFNPADFYIKTMAVVPGKEKDCFERIESICDGFYNSQYSMDIQSEIDNTKNNPKETGVIFEEAFSSTSRYESPWYVQFSAVFARCWKTTIREPMVLRVKLAQTLMLAVILGLIYLRLDLDQQGVMNINGVLFLFITNITFTNVFGVLNVIAVVLGLVYLRLDLDQQGVMDINGVLFLLVIQISTKNLFGVLNVIALLLGLIFLDLNVNQSGVMDINGILFLFAIDTSSQNVLSTCIVIGLLLGFIFFDLDVDQSGVMDINGILFLFIVDVTMQQTMSTCISFPVEVPIFMREYGIGLYRVDIYFICKSLAELPGIIFIPIIFASICYWMVGLYASAETFLIFVGILLLTANTAVSFGYIVSAAANSVTTALAIAPPLMIPLLMFGGFFLNADSIPVYFVWLEYMSWFKYANELLALNQWENIDAIDCPPIPTNATCNEGCLFPDGQSVIKYLNFDKDNTQIDYISLATLLVGYRFIAFIILFIKARVSKR